MSQLIAASEAGSSNVLALPLYEIIIALICFFIVFGALAKFALPNIKKTLDARADAIDGGIKRAEESQAEAAQLLEDYKQQLAEAREDAVIEAVADLERRGGRRHGDGPCRSATLGRACDDYCVAAARGRVVSSHVGGQGGGRVAHRRCARPGHG